MLNFILLFSASLAFTPTNIQSLTPTMSVRQQSTTLQFDDFRSFNRRRRVRRRVRFRCQSRRNAQFRTLSGFCNNLRFPRRGAADSKFLLLSRSFPNFDAAFNPPLPNARYVSNIVCNEDFPKPNKRGMSELVTFFGQFLDHDVTETTTDTSKSFRIIVPKDDPVFLGARQFIPFFKTVRRGRGSRKAPVNDISSYIDASSIYGVGEDTLKNLREFKGGRLKLPGNLLPRKGNGQFEAGDRRANENPNLTALHLVWAREHNTIAAEVQEGFPLYTDEEIFQLARHIVAAELQAVTYYSFLPALTGRLLPDYRGYRARKRAVISNRFSTVAFRVGHTMLNRTVNSIDDSGKLTRVMLRDSFFQPETFERLGIDSIFRGMMSGHAAEVDNGISSEVRNFLVASSRSKEQLDLAALNIQRGRDHEVPNCNELRQSVGLRPFRSFRQITRDETLRRKLELAYGGSLDIMDAWVCGVAEKHARGSSLGPLFQRIVRREFRRLRDGDRFYFENYEYFKEEQIAKLRSVQILADGDFRDLGSIWRTIIKRNTNIPDFQIPKDPFFV